MLGGCVGGIVVSTLLFIIYAHGESTNTSYIPRIGSESPVAIYSLHVVFNIINIYLGPRYYIRFSSSRYLGTGTGAGK